MISPGSGTIFTSTPVTFLWRAGAGAAQHQLAVGAACGGAEYYSASTGANGTVICPDGSLQCQSAAASSISVSAPTHDLCARLSTLISGAWQHIDYPYRAGPSPPGGTPNSIGFRYSSVKSVVNDGKPSTPPDKYLLCDSNSPSGQCVNTGNWDGGLVGDTCPVTFNLNGAPDPNVTVQPVAKGQASSSATVNSVDLTFTANAFTLPGSLREATCSYNGSPLNPITFMVYDATPQIYTDEGGNAIGIIQYPPVDPGGPFYIEVYGTGFGKTQGSLSVCAENADPCVTDPNLFDVAVTYWNVNSDGTSQVNALITPSPNVSAATYDVQLTSRGATGYFAAAPAPQTSQSQSNRGKVTPIPPLCTSTCVISGYVTTNDGKTPAGHFKPMAGVTLTISGGASVTTDNDGRYSFSVSAGSSVTLTLHYQAYQLVFNPKNPDNPSRCQKNPTSCFFYNIRANQTQDFTTTYTMVFLLHGLGQRHDDMGPFSSTLATSSGPPSGLDLSRFVVDAGFDFSECGANPRCTFARNGLQCSVGAGAMSLAQYISATAPADYVLIGYSMGGLIARRMLANTNTFPPNPDPIFQDLVATHRNVGLITLGTPNWGYPFLNADTNFYCPQIVTDMAGSWNPDAGPKQPSSFLSDLSRNWSSSSYSGYWLAAAGTYCQDPYRNFNLSGQPTGCPKDSLHSSSDGVVCTDSALYSAYSPLVTPFTSSQRPSIQWSDSTYVHTRTYAGWGSEFIFCKVPSTAPELFNPPPLGSLHNQIVQVINNGH